MVYWNQLKYCIPEAVMRKNIVVGFTNERIIPSGGLAVVGAILGKSDFVKNCSRMKVDCNHPQHQIKNGDVILTFNGIVPSKLPCGYVPVDMDYRLLIIQRPAGRACHELDESLLFQLA